MGICSEVRTVLEGLNAACRDTNSNANTFNGLRTSLARSCLFNLNEEDKYDCEYVTTAGEDKSGRTSTDCNGLCLSSTSPLCGGIREATTCHLRLPKFKQANTTAILPMTGDSKRAAFTSLI
mmetsp:Transcript_136066/g.236435  ORF Transcript_136066/g.236435 Transcript_136066/m.236435 type:complete len:122 (+) Transcript_136066:771-1136(+)